MTRTSGRFAPLPAPAVTYCNTNKVKLAIWGHW